MDALLRYRWPGNVRELRNVLERASILSDGGLITHEHLIVPPPEHPQAGAPAAAAPERSGLPPPPRAVRSASLADLERGAIERALAEARFNKSRAARALGLTRGQLYGRLRRLGIDSTD